MPGFRPPFLALIATLALASGCGSGGTTTPAGGSITLSVTPTGATIQQGGSTQVTGTITRTNFTADVAISVTGAPSGVTGNVTLAPVNGGNTAQVTLSAASSTTVGTYTLTVVASGSGISNATATFTLTIAAATPASYTMTLGTPTLSIAQGGTAPSAITVVRTAFTGNITLTAENLPTGVTAAFATNPDTGTTSSVTFTATSTAPPGTFNTILIRGTASGLSDVTASVTLTVTVTGSFTLAASSSSLNVVQGNNVSTSVNATRVGGFAGTIVYSVSGPANAALPTGLTAAVTATGTADQNTLTVTTTAGLAPGTYPLVVHATSFGAEQTANVSVVVAAAGSIVRLDYSLCVAAARPIWVAYQDGSGAFTRVTGTANVYTFTILATKGAVATVTQSGVAFYTVVQYFSQAEAATLPIDCAGATGKTINGTVAGLGAGDVANISMGGGGAVVAPPATAFQLFPVATGAQDLVAYRRNAATPGAANDRVIIRRGVNVADGGTLPQLDFTNVAEVMLPQTVTITLTGATAGNFIRQDQGYLTGAACTPHVLYDKSGTTTSLFVYGIPANQLASDFYRLMVTEEVAAGVSRWIATSFHTLANRAITMPTTPSPAVTIVTSAQNNYRLLQSALTLPADYQSATFIYSETTVTLRAASLGIGQATSYTIIQSAGYIGGASAVTMTATDLGTVSGYLASWGPSKTSAINYTTTATGTSGGSTCTEGSTTKNASVGGNLAPG